MNVQFISATFACLLMVSAIGGQESATKKSRAGVRLRDGTHLNVTILDESFTVTTRYGKQVIPLEDIRRIAFGLHYPLGSEKRIGDALGMLSSSAYTERESATRHLLEEKHFAYPLLKKASEQTTGDLEFSNRAKTILGRIRKKYPSDLLSIADDDAVETIYFPVVGRLSGTALSVHSEHLGELSLKFSAIKDIFNVGETADQEITVDAIKHGSDVSQWLETNVSVNRHIKLVITANGQVDLWPQGPGQYLTAPKGYTTAGKGSAFMAGSLVAKIGESGKPFLIAESHEGNFAEEGKLFLQITPSPWNNVSTGSYRVRIVTNVSPLK